ncbi:MAG: hypothetical protein V4475_03725 [Pseudomonadota bacterium]
MAKPIPTRFSVLPENETAAIAHLEARGYSPMAIEKDESGLIVLIFEPLPDDKMFGLVQALPGRLSAKVGIVMDGRPPFTPRPDA